MSSAAAAPPRPPLAELSIAMFLYPPNGGHPNVPHKPAALCPPSPVSLPLKRPLPIGDGSAGASGSASASASASTSGSGTPPASPQLKRRTPRASLADDELGVGKSPARRLFTDAPSSPSAPYHRSPTTTAGAGARASEGAPPITPHPHTHGASPLAPSPPLVPRRSSRLASQRDREGQSNAVITSHSNGASASSRPYPSSRPARSTSMPLGPSSHSHPTTPGSSASASGFGTADPGFSILADDDPRARTYTTTHRRTAQRTWPGGDEENVPPPPQADPYGDVLMGPPPVPGPMPGSGPRRRERSKLCLVAASASASVTCAPLRAHAPAPPATPAPVGKMAMKLEAEGIE